MVSLGWDMGVWFIDLAVIITVDNSVLFRTGFVGKLSLDLLV